MVPSTGPVLYTESILAHDLDSGELLWYHQARPSDPFDLDFGCHPMIVDAVAPAGYRGRAVRQCVIAGNKAGIFSFNRYTGERYWKVMLTKAGAPGRTAPEQHGHSLQPDLPGQQRHQSERGYLRQRRPERLQRGH